MGNLWAFLRLRQKSANELVTDAVHGEEITGILGHGLELLPDTDDMGVDGAGGRVVFIAPDLIEQAVAAQRLAGMAKKIFEKVELFSREFDRFAAAADLVAAQVHFDVAESVAVLFLGKGSRAPQHRLHPGQQLANGKRLGYVVVGA